MKVAVCVATYRRPNGLARLIEGLGALELAGDGEPEVEIVVVDNDPDGSAGETVERLRGDPGRPIRYESEPRRGISHARNRAIEAVIDSADFLAFLDDDEVPDPGWLSRLLETQRAYGADVVAGPVLPRFESPPAAWIARAGFFDRPRYPTGHEPEMAFTGNVLIRTAFLRDNGFRFDERWGMSGGEDSHFFSRIRRAGHRIVWADEAVVREWIPATRARASWLLRRAYRSGNSWSRIACDLRPGARTRVIRGIKGLARVAQGTAWLPVAVFAGRGAAVRALQFVFLGAGSVTGAIGLRYEEYRKVHGS